MSPDLEVEIAENDNVPDHYIITGDTADLSAHARIDHEDFEYALTWDAEVYGEPDDILSHLTGVESVEEVDMPSEDLASISYRDFFDTDGDRWGCDFGEESVTANIPSRQKLTSETLVELYSETAAIEEETAYQILEALQEEAP